MIAIGYNGPMLLEDAHDLAYIMVMTGKTIHPSKWIDEWRLQAEGNAFSAFGV